MQIVTVGSKYQVVIPKSVRKKIKGLIPGDRVVVKQGKGGSIIIDKVDDNWVEKTRGLMAEAWKDIDPIAELEKMRDEWERK